MGFEKIKRGWTPHNLGYLLYFFATIFFLYQYSVRTAVPSVFNEDFRQYFSIDATKMGGLVSLFYLSYTLMQIPVGLIIDRFSTKKILGYAFFIMSIGEICFVLTDVYIVAAISQIILGIGASFAFILVLKVCDDSFTREKVALMSSLSFSIGSIGPTIMNPALAYFSTMFSWKFIVIFIGMFGVILSTFSILIFREKKDDSKKTPIQDDICIWSEIKKIALDKQYLFLGIFSMLSLSALSTFCDTWGLTFLRNALGYSKESASMLLSVSYVGIILGEPLSAWMSRRWYSFKKVMIYNTVLSLPLYIFILTVKMNQIELGIVLFFLGLLGSCQFLTFPFAMCCAPKKIGGTLNGFLNMVTMLGVTAMAYLIGLALDLSHGVMRSAYTVQDYHNSFILLPISVVISIVALFFIRDIYPLKRESK